jgi:DNA invertase Pin-like site-specific DNA recombinase
VIAWDFDRFYREKRSVAGYILDTLDEHKKQITSVKQPIPVFDPPAYDPRENDTPYLLREMAGFTSGMDNRRRFRTLRKGLKDKVAQGYMVYVAPYGYRKALKFENGKVVKLPREIVPEEADVVRRIFRDYKDGKGYLPLVCDLNRDKIPTKRGGPWNVSTIGNMIRNPVYCGLLRSNMRKEVGRRTLVNPESAWRIMPGKHAPIIPEELWREVQEIRKRRQRHSRAVGSPLLLSGLVRCSLCGWSMCKENSALGGYYACGNHRSTGNCERNSYRRLKLEKDVLAYLGKVLQEEDLFDLVRERQEVDTGSALRADIERLEKTLRDIPTRRNKLFSLFETDDITKEEFLDRKDALSELEEDTAGTLTEKQAHMSKIETKKLDRKTFERALVEFRKNLEEGTLGASKNKLSALIERITLMRGTFKIRFRFPGGE